MEGDTYFVALTLQDSRDENGPRIFTAEELIEMTGDIPTRDNLIAEVLQAVEEQLRRSFTVKTAFVVPCVPFEEPTLCEVEITYQGVKGANSESDARKLTRIVDQFTVSPEFDLGDAFHELRARATRWQLGNPIAHNYSPVRF